LLNPPEKWTTSRLPARANIVPGSADVGISLIFAGDYWAKLGFATGTGGPTVKTTELFYGIRGDNSGGYDRNLFSGDLHPKRYGEELRWTAIMMLRILLCFYGDIVSIASNIILFVWKCWAGFVT
jgi:hypothetical protein